jgi:tetratricopeptide (TPR) repeat protein
MPATVRAKRAAFGSGCGLFTLLLLSTSAPAQMPTNTSSDSGVVVHVQEATGGPIESEAVVKLNGTSWIQTTATQQQGIATFNRIPAGDYQIEVSAPGYETAQDHVNVFGHGTTEAFIALRHTGESVGQKAYPGMPLLIGKAKKELDAAVKALQDNHLSDAASHINAALKSAPAHPDVQYVAGLIAVAQKDNVAAQKYYLAAIGIYPNHVGAQIGLASMMIQQNHAAEAIPHLEKAAAVSPNQWRAHWLLAEAYLDAGQDPAKAKTNATRAIELGGQKAVDAQVTLARAEIAGGEREAARTQLEKYVHDYPANPGVPRAQLMLRRLSAPDVANAVAAVKATLTASTGPITSATPDPTAADTDFIAAIPANSILTLPANVDEFVPPVDLTATCSLPQVLEGAGRRLSEFVDGLEKFTAREEVVHDELDASGATKKTYDHTFQYLATVDHPRSDTIILEESRDGTQNLANFPAPMAVEGLPALGLIFHPDYTPDFNFTCEGLGQWVGQPAWQVRFEQRTDRPARIHDWVVGGLTYSTMLKGRAWFSAASFRLVHLETDLAKPIPQIHLDYQHMEIEYRPVSFKNGSTELWLPASAEVYSRYKGHFFRQEHDFSDFMLFSIDVIRKDSVPSDHP